MPVHSPQKGKLRTAGGSSLRSTERGKLALLKRPVVVRPSSGGPAATAEHRAAGAGVDEDVESQEGPGIR